MRKQWIFWLGAVCVLILLYLTSSTDLIIREPEEKIYRISVIIDDNNDDAYANFRQGIDQAALDLHVDVSFITLYTAGDEAEQLERVLREIADGADALVLVPINSERLAETATQAQIPVPVIYVKDSIRLTNKVNSGSYQFDYEGIGVSLARRAQEVTSVSKEGHVLFLSSEEPYGSRKQVVEGAKKLLTSEQMEVLNLEDMQQPDARIITVLQKYPNTIVAALDTDAMIYVLDMQNRHTEEELACSGIYSVGCNVQIVNNLRKGRFTGIYFTDDYTAGYRSIQSLSQKLDNVLDTMEEVEDDYFYVDKRALDTGEYDKLLLPMG